MITYLDPVGADGVCFCYLKIFSNSDINDSMYETYDLFFRGLPIYTPSVPTGLIYVTCLATMSRTCLFFKASSDENWPRQCQRILPPYTILLILYWSWITLCCWGWDFLLETHLFRPRRRRHSWICLHILFSILFFSTPDATYDEY
jgi:hypothetical protein